MNWYMLTAERICVDISQREYINPKGCVWHALQFILGELLKPYQHDHCSRRTEKRRRVNPSHAPSYKFGENKGLNALAKLLKVMDIPRSELDWVLQPFGINK